MTYHCRLRYYMSSNNITLVIPNDDENNFILKEATCVPLKRDTSALSEFTVQLQGLKNLQFTSFQSL